MINILDENAQSSAEFILLFGGIIIIVLIAIIIYKNYSKELSENIISNDLISFNSEIERISSLF